MTESTIRPAIPQDSEAVLRCLHEAFEPYRSLYSAQSYLDTTLDRDSVVHRLREMHVLIAITAVGEVVGTVGGAANGTSGHLRGMAVLPKALGSGVARTLLDAIESYLRSLGCTVVTLNTTEPLQRAMRFYERNGYRGTGRIGDFFGMRLIEYAKPL